MADRPFCKDLRFLLQPRNVVIIGASAQRVTGGNRVIRNLKEWGYKGQIFPVHPSAARIEDLICVNSVDALPGDVDVAVISIPAPSVKDALVELEKSPISSAIVFTSGFSTYEQQALYEYCAGSRLLIHGPNCMGLVNFSDSIALSTASPSPRTKPGKIALVLQSGSASISVPNTLTAGLSRVITTGSEFQISTADYLNWLADDDETQVIGVVIEAIKDPVNFAAAAERAHSNGKSLVVLKVGKSALGQAATVAHTGAMITGRDGYDNFFESCNIATVDDYDELVASLECAVIAPKMVAGGSIAIAGISGGETALACDLAESKNVPLAKFQDETSVRIASLLPGTTGHNPLDIGATGKTAHESTPDALRAIMNDSNVGAVVVLQDGQKTLSSRTLESYMRIVPLHVEAGKAAKKPLVVVSPTSEELHPRMRECLQQGSIPLLRGLQEGLVAVRNLGKGQPGPAGAWARSRSEGQPSFREEAYGLRRALEKCTGTLEPKLSSAILQAYGIPFVRSIVVANVAEAHAHAHEIGYPMVIKVVSNQIQHRSDVGGVILGVDSDTALELAIQRIEHSIGSALPAATIDGFELQEQLFDTVEAMAGFTTAAPFGPLVVLASGGTLVELINDRAVELAPVNPVDAHAMLTRTNLGKRLGGYRNLMPGTDTTELETLVVNLSQMATDLQGVILACDLNPILVRAGTGEVRVVDALCVCA